MKLRFLSAIAIGFMMLACRTEPSIEEKAAQGRAKMRRLADKTTEAELAKAEIRVADYLFKSPKQLGGILGRETGQQECIDTDGRLIAYERGWICVNNGVIVLFAWNLQQRVQTQAQALHAVGLEMTAQPVCLAGCTWAKSLHNALKVGNTLATRVTVSSMDAQPQNVIVKVGRE